MKFFHTADWHLGKLVQGVYMTEDQRYVLQQFIQAIEEERPDAVIIAGDLYDRGVPPTEAVHLLDEILDTIVLQLKTPVLAIAGNHDSPSRLHFGSNIMKQNGLHMSGRLTKDLQPVILQDDFGPVHFHLVPYCDPSLVRNLFEDEEVRTHQDAARKIVTEIKANLDPKARHVLIGHAFVTPFGEEEENTSDSERPLSIGGAEYVDAQLFADFHYTALGHLHQAHYVMQEKIRYAGSILKYSISEEHHRKGYSIVELDQDGEVSIEKRLFTPKREMRTIEATMSELLTDPVCEDYVFVRLLDETPILSPMEKIRSVYPNAMHVERKHLATETISTSKQVRSKMSDLELFQSFYEQVKGEKASEETERIFREVLDELLREEQETATPTQREVVPN
ncbi:exonuclease SbcCD subunit D [Lederbergia sp. NSJ-179]|uniref:exonuclease SbcCD subunit D n=1 Tax=Lederbergia sp. NSJ-179 TaxID=2931402 RepID=UPI001FCF94A3|nr:exonuclease SbcCD subunit D [Lederbergia sp. NSJ-179]MCJ7841036.1 exonuclease SbcCD subunit D [Lederbergia sp. NSJ-179]